MTQPRIYLAGPEVFLPNVAEAAAAKKKICERHGLTGVFPLDAEIKDLGALAPDVQARRISEENEALIKTSDAVIANCTPFRSVSMDVGTAYELGFARALGLPLFGYSNQSELLHARTERYNRTLGPDAIDPYTAGTDIENFGLFENLMIGVALRNLDCDVVLRDVEPGKELTDLAGFEECVVIASAALGATTVAP